VVVCIIGETIRRIRKLKSHTLEKVSRQTGLSVGFLSQVEHNQSMPSLTSLRKIAEALECSVFTLLAAEDGGVHVVRRGRRKTFRCPDHKVTYELLSPDHNRSRMELAFARLRPGCATCDSPLAHNEGEEFAFVVSGRVRVELGNDSHDLEEGDSVYFNSCIPHRYLNVGEEVACLLTAMTPPTF